MNRPRLIGAATGFIIVASAFGLIHYAFFGDDPKRHAEGFTPDLQLALAASTLGSIAGAYVGGRAGSVELGGSVGGAARGALAGVAVAVLLGLASSSAFPPKQAEAHKADWLRLGVPVGAWIGILIGVMLTSRNHPGPTPDGRPPP